MGLPTQGCNGQAVRPIGLPAPVHGRVLVRRLPPPDRSRGGVLLPKSWEGRWQYEPGVQNCLADVLEVPAQVPITTRPASRAEGKLPRVVDALPEIRPGDRVLLDRYAADPIDDQGHSYVEYRHLLAVVEGVNDDAKAACSPPGEDIRAAEVAHAEAFAPVAEGGR